MSSVGLGVRDLVFSFLIFQISNFNFFLSFFGIFIISRVGRSGKGSLISFLFPFFPFAFTPRSSQDGMCTIMYFAPRDSDGANTCSYAGYMYALSFEASNTSPQSAVCAYGSHGSAEEHG